MTANETVKDQISGLVYAFNCLTAYLRYMVDSVAPGDITTEDTPQLVKEVMTIYKSLDELGPRLQKLADIYNVGFVPGPPLLCCPIGNVATSNSINVIDRKVRMRMVYGYYASLDTLWDMIHPVLKATNILSEETRTQIKEGIWDLDYSIEKIRTFLGL
jgi:hypothetical protein